MAAITYNLQNTVTSALRSCVIMFMRVFAKVGQTALR